MKPTPRHVTLPNTKECGDCSAIVLRVGYLEAVGYCCCHIYRSFRFQLTYSKFVRHCHVCHCLVLYIHCHVLHCHQMHFRPDNLLSCDAPSSDSDMSVIGVSCIFSVPVITISPMHATACARCRPNYYSNTSPESFFSNHYERLKLDGSSICPWNVLRKRQNRSTVRRVT